MLNKTNTFIKLNRIKLILMIFCILSLAGCVEPEVGTPAPTPAMTIAPTVIPTTPIPVPTPAPSPEISTPVKYRVWIDSDYGFYRIRAIRGDTYVQLPPDFDILNLTIKVGDSVRWMNDDSYDYPLTIVSNEGLWTGRTGYLRWQGERFEYIFIEKGTFTFFIKEYNRIKPQKIIVE